ncbi:MAG: hypothetical protein JWM88_3348 [Verrucomicrobia bacterium]|nr:hypothetical protein [Verrucomicrobiota bacterium]
MEKLLPLAPVTLGASNATASGGLSASLDAGRGCWRVDWTGPAGGAVFAECRVGGDTWSKPAPMPAVSRKETQRPAASASPLPDGTLACMAHAHGSVAVRSGKRVVGRPPCFPSASLVFSREKSGTWCDLAFADEAPEAEIGPVALAVSPNYFLAAYVIAAADGAPACRVVQLANSAPGGESAAWERLPSYPQAPGMASCMTGMHRGFLLAVGGANFPDLPPWDGGKKSYYDQIYVLAPGAKAWVPAGRLPAPRAYGATVTLPDGVLIAGGENADQVFQDTLLLQWDGTQVQIRSGPPLPEPATCSAAVVLDGEVYLSGGYGPGLPRLSRDFFWRLRLAHMNEGWQALPSWPGPTRALAVTAAVGGAVYLVSGIEISAAPGTAAVEAAPSVYLRDAYRYRPGTAWEKLPDPPWSALAAPSPAPVTSAPDRVFVLGGVDGRQVGHLPRATALPNDIIYFEVAQNRWRHWPEPWPQPVVCVSAVERDSRWIVVSGETMAGKRTTDVWGWRIGP